MSRFRNVQTGVVFSVSDDKDSRYAGDLHEPYSGEEEQGDGPDGYESMTVVDLKAEIKSRNEGRDDADKVPADGNKAELIAALEADDANSDD